MFESWTFRSVSAVRELGLLVGLFFPLKLSSKNTSKVKQRCLVAPGALYMAEIAVSGLNMAPRKHTYGLISAARELGLLIGFFFPLGVSSKNTSKAKKRFQGATGGFCMAEIAVSVLKWTARNQSDPTPHARYPRCVDRIITNFFWVNFSIQTKTSEIFKSFTLIVSSRWWIHIHRCSHRLYQSILLRNQR